MAQRLILSLRDTDEKAVEETARQVGADILQQYRHLATRLRQQAWQEFARIGSSFDPTERASGSCAYQLYTTAASEFDAIIVDLRGGLDHAGNNGSPPGALLIAYDLHEEELQTGGAYKRCLSPDGGRLATFRPPGPAHPALPAMPGLELGKLGGARRGRCRERRFGGATASLLRVRANLGRTGRRGQQRPPAIARA